MIFNRFINFQVAGISCRLIIDDPNIFAYFNKIYVEDKIARKILAKIYIKKEKDCYRVISKPFNFDFHLTISDKFLFKDIDWIIRTLLQFNLIKYKIIFLHSSSFIKDDNINIFLGKSEAGKSTIIKNAPKKDIFGDDITIIRKEKNIFFAYQSPFEKDRISDVKIGKMPIIGMFHLKKGKSFKVAPIDNKDKFNLLITDSYMPRFPKDKNDLKYIKNIRKFNDLILILIKNVSIKKLYFPKNFRYKSFLPVYG